MKTHYVVSARPDRLDAIRDGAWFTTLERAQAWLEPGERIYRITSEIEEEDGTSQP